MSRSTRTIWSWRCSTRCSLPSQMPKESIANCHCAFTGQTVRPVTLPPRFRPTKTNCPCSRSHSLQCMPLIDHQWMATLLLNSFQLSGLFPFSESDRSSVENAPSNYIDCMPEFSEFFQSAPYSLNEPNKASMMSAPAATNVSNTSPAIAPNFIDGKSVSYILSFTSCILIRQELNYMLLSQLALIKRFNKSN